MLRKIARTVWDILPHSVLLKMIRVTQAKFTVSAAVVIVNEKGEVLVLNHALRFNSGWGLPGGFMERGEQPEDGIRREIREETGIELDSLRLLSVRVIGSHIEMMFAAVSVGEPEVMSREILELGWFTPETLPEKMSGGQKGLIGKVLNGEV
ncbi:MAG: NUDIX hydrolase [Saprospiraceae bacterium]|nr:NUDIX hydrolase [Pyrinomonadaceae bacterium]